MSRSFGAWGVSPVQNTEPPPRRGEVPTPGHERMSPCPSSRSVSSRSGSRSRGGGGFFHSDHMTFAYYEIEAGSEVHLHHHPQEEVWHVVEGELELPGDREQPGRRRMAASGGFTAAARTRRCDGGGRC